MNIYSNVKKLPVLTVILGLAVMALRLLLYGFCQDGRGLVNDGHILSLLVWGLTSFAAVLTVLFVWQLDGSLKYADNFSPSRVSALGAFALAAGIALTLLSSLLALTGLERLRNLAALIAVPSLIWVGICRWRGKRPSFIFHAAVCLYLTLFAVSHYQTWSSRPQLQDYLFTMGGVILLMLFAYYQTAFDVGLGKRRMQLLTGLMAAFACLAALAQGEDLLLYLTGAVWALTNLCRLVPVPRARKHTPAPTEEPDTTES